MEKRELKIIPIILSVAILVWFADAAIDAFIFGHGSFKELAFYDLTAHELYFRFFFITIYSAVVILLWRVLGKKKQVQQELEKHVAAVETSMDGIAIFDRKGAFLFANHSFASLNGYDRPRDIVGRTYQELYEERSIGVIEQAILPTMERSGKWRGELIAKRKNGSTYFQEVSVTRLADDDRVCIVRDITWRKRSEERLRRSERFLNMIFNSIRDPFCIFDADFRIIRANEAYAQLKGKTMDKLIGRKCYEALNEQSAVCEGCVVDKTFQSKDPCAKEKPVTLPNGTEAWVEIYTYPILDEEGRVTHVIEYTRDVTERKRSEEEKHRLIEKLEHLSRTDALTGLLNRRALSDSLSYEIDRAVRYDSSLSLLICDIDDFKEINDTLGHDAGDRALQTISATLRTLLRKTDIAGRYGGDEFMLILPETALAGAESLAEKLRSTIEAIEFPFKAGISVRLSMSIGVADLAPGGESMDSLVKRADDAMYAWKQENRNKPKS